MIEWHLVCRAGRKDGDVMGLILIITAGVVLGLAVFKNFRAILGVIIIVIVIAYGSKAYRDAEQKAGAEAAYQHGWERPAKDAK